MEPTCLNPSGHPAREAMIVAVLALTIHLNGIVMGTSPKMRGSEAKKYKKVPPADAHRHLCIFMSTIPFEGGTLGSTRGRLGLKRAWDDPAVIG